MSDQPSLDQPSFKGPRCPECGTALSWPTRRLPGHHELHCRNGHYLCTMEEFRQAAYEMAMSEEYALHRPGLSRRAG